MGIEIPDTPLIVAGAVGGPFAMYMATPARNALTYASKDINASFTGIYRQVFASGAFTGGVYPAVAACPQFIGLGPLFHLYNGVIGLWPAVVVVSASETAMVYGAETKNAQEAVMAKGVDIPKNRVQSPFMPWGPGLGMHIMRNTVAMAGLRVFKDPWANMFEKLAGKKTTTTEVAGDFMGNVCGSALSMPFHQMYAFQATSPETWDAPMSEQGKLLTDYLKRQYLTESGGISPVLVRDLKLRICFLTGAYTTFATIERALVAFWPR